MRCTSPISSATSIRPGGAGGGFEIAVSTSGRMLRLAVVGPHAAQAFASEAGGHRFQHVPDHDRRGRVHSSTVTVAVLDAEADPSACPICDADLHWQVCRSGGPGGQHVNKTASAVILTHRPSGIQIRAEDSRHQQHNRQEALRRLRERLRTQATNQAQDARNRTRAAHIGSGERSDKIRTIRMQDGQVLDHRTGRRCTLRSFLAGDLDGIVGP